MNDEPEAGISLAEICAWQLATIIRHDGFALTLEGADQEIQDEYADEVDEPS